MTSFQNASRMKAAGQFWRRVQYLDFKTQLPCVTYTSASFSLLFCGSFLCDSRGNGWVLVKLLTFLMHNSVSSGHLAGQFESGRKITVTLFRMHCLVAFSLFKTQAYYTAR